MGTKRTRLLQAVGILALVVGSAVGAAPEASAATAPTDPQVVFVVSSSTPEIGITDLYGIHTSVINVAPAGGVGDPVLAPNGTKIAFDWNCTLYTVDTDGSDLTALPNSSGGCERDPAWSPSSSQLAFNAFSSGVGGVWVANADGSDPVEIASGGSDPSWSPDGTRIALVEVTDHQSLETIPSSGGPATVLASLPLGIGATGSYLTAPAWSPDGTTIAYFEGIDAGGIPAGGTLYLVAANGSNNRVVGGYGGFLGDGNGNFGASWCPNGRCLLSEFARSNSFEMVDTNGSVASSITANGNEARFVGVQGLTPSSPPPPPTTGGASTASGHGFWAAGADGGIFTYGDAQFSGSMGGRPLNRPVVGMASTPDGGGYWQVASDGGLFSFGDAVFSGSMGGRPLNKPVVGMAADPATGGYWEVASDGGIFSFDAPFFGSTGSIRLNQPVVGMAATSDGGGYWLVAADGGIFAFGDAVFQGSMGGTPLNAPVTSMAAAPGGGYWLVAADGGVFSFGSARFQGSMGGVPLAQPVISLVPANPTNGYREITAGGGVFNFSAPLG